VVNAYSVVNSTANGIYTWDGKTLVSSKAKYVLVDHVEQTIEWVSDRWRILREGKYFTDSAYTKSSSGVHPSSSGWLTASGRYVPSVKAGENMAGDVKGMDFCYNPNITMSSVPLKATDWSADSQSSNGRMNKCEGDCDDDKNCAGKLKCFQRNAKQSVPGCAPGGLGDVSGWDYCYSDSATTIRHNGCSDVDGCEVNRCPTLEFVNSQQKCTDLKPPSISYKCDPCPSGYDSKPVNNVCKDTNGCANSPCDSLQSCSDIAAHMLDRRLVATGGDAHKLTMNGRMTECMGDCDIDANCAAGLKCFQRNINEQVKGCTRGGNQDIKGADYCYDPSAQTSYAINFIDWSAEKKTMQGNMRRCEGDCDSDANCQSGLKCFQRNKREAIKGCLAGGSGDYSGWDYCYDPAATLQVFSCSACPSGYNTIGKFKQVCQDINDCDRSPAPCGSKTGTPITACTNTGPNSWACKCPVGYGLKGSSTQPTCVLVDSCSAEEDDCVTGLPTKPSFAQCQRDSSADGKHLCKCPTGYVGDGKTVQLEATHVSAHLTKMHGHMPACMGDCDADNNCREGLKCFQRSKLEAIKGCASGGKGDVTGADYCYDPKANRTAPLYFVDWSAEKATFTGRMHMCQGDCDGDGHCLGDMICAQRNGDEPIYGCTSGGAGDVKGWDYCTVKKGTALPEGHGCQDQYYCVDHNCATLPKKNGILDLRAVHGDAHNQKMGKIMQACTGDCDSDAQCDQTKGLKCFQPASWRLSRAARAAAQVTCRGPTSATTRPRRARALRWCSCTGARRRRRWTARCSTAGETVTPTQTARPASSATSAMTGPRSQAATQAGTET